MRLYMAPVFKFLKEIGPMEIKFMYHINLSIGVDGLEQTAKNQIRVDAVCQSSSSFYTQHKIVKLSSSKFRTNMVMGHVSQYWV